MKDRVRVTGNMAIVTLITGRKGDADTGLILHGAMDCFELAKHLIEAGEKIMDNERTGNVPCGQGYYGRRKG